MTTFRKGLSEEERRRRNREKVSAWRAAHPERLRDIQRKANARYRLSGRERELERRRSAALAPLRAATREAVQQARAQARAAWAEVVNASRPPKQTPEERRRRRREEARRYYAAHPERRSAINRRHYEKHYADHALLFTATRKRYVYAFLIRRGVCADCGRVRRPDEHRFHLDHEAYDRRDPLAHTRERCPACHRRRHARTWKKSRTA